MTLDELYKIIQDRKKNMPEDSYVASLFRDGEDRIVQKIGEETTEVIIAAKNKAKRRIVSEIADLCFHLLILMSQLNIPLKDIYDELESRKNKRKTV